VGSDRSLALGIVVHELATNAVKYGALSTGDGRVAIRSSVSESRLTLEWEETGGPDVSPPAAEGFGLALIRGQVEYQLEGQLDVAFDRRGLRLSLGIPLAGPGRGEAAR
jgi:two-component system CheB/CheR fusion protein